MGDEIAVSTTSSQSDATRKSPLVWGLVAVLLGGVITGAVWWFWSKPNPAALTTSAIASIEERDFDNARQKIRELEALENTTDEVRLLRAGLLLKTGDVTTALNAFALLDPKGPHGQTLLLWTTEALYLVGNLLAAERTAQQVLTEEEDNLAAHRWLAAISYDLGNLTSAEIHLNKVIELAPDDWKPHRLLGDMHSDFDQHKQAITDYEAALERDPPAEAKTAIVNGLAKSLMKQRQYTQAAGLLEEHSDKEAVAGRLAECYWNLGRRPEAKEQLALASKNEATNEILLLKGRIASFEKRLKDAVVPLEEILETEPYHIEALHELSQVYRRLKLDSKADAATTRKEEATELYKKMTDLSQQANQNPTDPAIRREMAQIWQKLGNDELAEAWEKAAAALQSAQSASE